MASRRRRKAHTASSKGSVFLCWSGTRSGLVAGGLKKLIEQVVPGLTGRVFHSPDIEKGARWFEEVLHQLEGARAGVICMTSDNLGAPWLHFESGALIRGLQRTGGPDVQPARVFTYVHGVPPASLSGPLAQYQSTSTTREDTRSLIGTLAGSLALSPEGMADRFNKRWPAFERTLQGARLKVPELLPDFEDWFKRKTFDEPVQECADQNWIGRYDGARDTYDKLRSHHERVKHACPTYQIDLYGRLVQFLDSYVMAIKGLLVRARPFKIKDDGLLDIEPRGVAAACEARRQRIKEIVSRILDPLAVPTTQGAAAFWLADSFAEKKMLVHRCEFVVLGRHRGPDAVPTAIKAGTLLESVWELDRIFSYLAYEHRHAGRQQALEKVLQGTMIELERLNAQGSRSLIALHYALGALEATVEQRSMTARQKVRAEVLALTQQVRETIERRAGSRRPNNRQPVLDRGGQVRRTLREIETLFRSTGPTAARQTTARTSLRRV